jgi:hypothetical protein
MLAAVKQGTHVAVTGHVVRIARDRSEIKTAFTHEIFKHGMRNDPYVMARGLQS